MEVYHKKHYDYFPCPMCGKALGDIIFDDDNPKCKEEIKCAACHSVWRLVTDEMKSNK